MQEREEPDNSFPDEPELDQDEVAESEPGSMGFLDHLEELRWTLVKSLASFLIACTLIGIFVFQFADLLRWPYEFATAGRPDHNDDLYVRNFLGSFAVMFQLFFLGGLGLSLPAILYFVGKFVAPGLTRNELRMMLPGSVAAFVLFVLGAVFSFFILLPAGLKASVYFADMFGFKLLIDASSYYGLVMWATVGVGTAFEFPLLLILLIHLGILQVAHLVHYRRHAIVGFLALSAIVTPTPDPITFLFLAVPLWILYEISILFGRRLERRRREQRIVEDELD